METRRGFLFAASMVTVAGCSAVDEVAKVADEGVKAADEAAGASDEVAGAGDDVAKAVTEVDDEAGDVNNGAIYGSSALDEAGEVNQETEIDTQNANIAGEVAYSENQAVLLQSGQFFAERFSAPADSKLVFRMRYNGDLVTTLQTIGHSISVFTSSEYEVFQNSLQTESSDPVGLNGEYNDGLHIFNLPEPTTYAIVIREIAVGTIEETPLANTPSPNSVQISYAIYV